MKDREKLVELLDRAHRNVRCVIGYDGSEGEALEEEARYLLAHGVIVLPCKAGDEVWYLNQSVNDICRAKILEVHVDPNIRWPISIQFEHYHHKYGRLESGGQAEFIWEKELFPTREEAETALKRGQNDTRRNYKRS